MSKLNILSETEQHEFDCPPNLSVEARSICFAIDDELGGILRRLRGATNKVGFLLQYAYFKACRHFFFVKKFRHEDVEYATKLLDVPLDNIDLQKYRERTPQNHQVKILELFQCKSYASQKHWVKKEVKIRVERIAESRELFFDVLHQLHQHNIEIPNYHSISDLITDTYFCHEESLLKKVRSKTTKQQVENLESLLSSDKKLSNSRIIRYKNINQSLKPKPIQASVNLFKQIQDLIDPLMPLIDSLKLSPQACSYYATWVEKAKLSQLKQLPDKRKLALRLTAFLQHQYSLRQDSFIDILLRSVQSTKNTAIHQLEKIDSLTRNERRTAVRHLTKSYRDYKTLVDEVNDITKSNVLSDSGKVEKIKDVLEAHAKAESVKEHKKLDMLEKSLDEMAKNKDYFTILEKLSRKLQNRVSSIMKVVSFNSSNSNKNLLAAIAYFKEKDGRITSQAPTDFLTTDETEALTQESTAFRSQLYKVMLFIHVADAIKSGDLNLTCSNRYLAIQDYLIDRKTWKEKRSELLKLARLDDFSDCQTVMSKLKKSIDGKYHNINERIQKNLNPHITFSDNEDSLIKVATPALDEKETRNISAFLNQAGYVPILQILTDIDQVTGFSESFKHHSLKYKKARPQESVFHAGIIGFGCNIGIQKMAQISSGINQSTMTNTVKWYFSLGTLNSANQRIREFINRLALPHVFAHQENERHSSSDGRKVGVSVECLLATYSFKYFGKDKGVSIYTFIDDRQVLFHHNVMSSSEREAAYVIDGLNNMSSPKIDIHSTDTHGYTELIFAATHLLGTAFAPRIKSIGKQKIYAFKSKKVYKKLGYKVLPSRPISQKLIEKHWDDILRFMATIRLNKVSASQLFKRLSSYAKDNPLYKALKEFGRIIKSIFILTYFDDVKLRQRIEKQLNRIESSNKFAKAVFYANNSEFKQAGPSEQNTSVACKVMIQNSIVLWNYLYLSQILTNCADANERMEMISLVKEGSVLTWGHVNLHGEFDFRHKPANETPFNLAKIFSLQMT